MELFSYVVARDYGFAPNPFFGFCTLCTCKPIIRRVAVVGDWILGTGTKTRNREDHIVFALCVTEAFTFDEYWTDPRFECKRPMLRGSKKRAFGDNIYHRGLGTQLWIQEDSHHSHPDGTPNPANVMNDTQTNRILISNDYIYFGGSGPQLPARFRAPGHDLRAGRGHRRRFPAGLVVDFVTWIRSLDDSGYVGEPLDWIRTP